MKKVGIVYCVMILMSIFLLQACSTSNTSPLDKGRDAFESQDYHVAFVDLLPLAQKGDQDAQYAVGYMYYNGLGVGKDYKTAQSWLQKSADQGDAKAQKALNMIEQAKQSEPFPAPPALDMTESGK